MFPNIPTDNLYKFIALSGLLIVLAALYYYATQVTELQDRVNDSTLLMDELSVKLEHWKSKVDLAKRITEASISMRQGKKVIGDNKLLLTYTNEETKQLMEDIDEYELEVSLLKARYEFSARVSDNLIDHIAFVKWTSLSCILFGVWLMFHGFAMWYFKVQKLQDQILAKEALSLEE